MNEIESKSKPRRAQGGKGLLSHQISVQKSHQSIPLIPSPREEREEEEKKERGARNEGEWPCSGAGKKSTREREGQGIFNPLTLD